MCSPLGGRRARNGPTQSTNKGAGVPRNPQTEIYTHIIVPKIECAVCPSVEGLAYMHRILFSTSIDTDDTIASAAQKERLLSVGRKSKVSTDAEDSRPTYLKWQLLIDPHGYQPPDPTNGNLQQLEPAPL
jgi:hypothetical protein